jgi:hypothetical protein
MAADLQEFNGIIEELKAVINQPDFDEQFKSATIDVPKSKQFLIKMELKRLAQPCARLIDLRGSVDGETSSFEHKGQVHYLDELAKKIFEQQIEKFGRYTVGVYEAVLHADNNFKIMDKIQQEKRLTEKDKTLAPKTVEKVKEKNPANRVISEHGGEIVHFAQYGIRNEERMNFSINVELQFGIGNVLKASTSDLSISGAKVKIPSAKDVALGQKISLFLTGLEDEVSLNLTDGIQYEIVGIENAGPNYNYIRMKRSFAEEVGSFDEFLSDFINSNKRRYKVNLENTLDAIIIKGFEQYYLPRATSLPIFMREVQGRLLPTMALATENNRETLGYFSDENKSLILQQVLNEARIDAILSSGNLIQESLLFCFTHAKQGKLYFYTATSEELNASPELKDAFIGFGSKKASWKVFKLQVSIANEADGYLPLSIPDSAGEEIKLLNQPPSEKIQSMLAGLKYVVTMTPLTGDNFAEQYQQTHEFSQDLVRKLTQFGHPKLKRYISIVVESIEYVNLRSEERYLYKSGICIEDPNSDTSIYGETRDFSEHGLQIVLDEADAHKKGDIVLLSMPDFQRVTKAFKLEKLPYEVMTISRNKLIINLRTFEPNGEHIASKFFKKLINQNKAKLTPAKMESKFHGLSKCLRNIAAKSIHNFPMYFAKENSKLRVNTAGKGTETNLLHQMLLKYKPDAHETTFYPLLKDHALISVFSPILTKLKRADKPEYVDLYLRFRPNEKSEIRAFMAQYDDQFMTTEKLTSFIDSAIKTDIFFAYRVFISRTGRPDMNYIAKELAYVGDYALHRAKEIEERLWNVIGVGDVIDISEEVMTRLGFENSQLKQQMLKKNRLVD